MKYDLSIGSTYNVTLHAPAILTSGFSNATVRAILDYETAAQHVDVAAIHAAVLPELPSGTPTDPALLEYVKFKTSSGATTIVAMQWMSAQPTLVQATNLRIEVFGQSLSDIPRIQAILKGNGIDNFTITAA